MPKSHSSASSELLNISKPRKSLRHGSILAAWAPPYPALGNDQGPGSSLMEAKPDMAAAALLVFGGIPNRNKPASAVLESSVAYLTSLPKGLATFHPKLIEAFKVLILEGHGLAST